jgi:hypothetical protein
MGAVAVENPIDYVPHRTGPVLLWCYLDHIRPARAARLGNFRLQVFQRDLARESVREEFAVE